MNRDTITRCATLRIAVIASLSIRPPIRPFLWRCVEPMTTSHEPTLTGYFASIEEARQCVVDLLVAGFPEDQVRLVESTAEHRPAVSVVASNGTRARAEGILRRDHARLPKISETVDRLTGS
jgi:hypothetical protein